MPKVEQYGGQRVNTQVVKGARAGNVASGAFGSPLIEGVVNLGQGLAEMKQRIDTTAAEEALVKFERDKNDVFFNPESGYFNTSGKSAYESAQQVQEKLDQLKRSYGDQLESQFARESFNKVADRQLNSAYVDVQRHASKGLKTWEIATINSQVENTIENASLYHNDPEKLEVQRVLGRQGIIDAANMEGIGSEATNEKLQTYESSFASSAINAAIRNSSTQGQEMLDKYSSRLEPQDRQKLEADIAKKQKAEKLAADAQLSVIEANRLVEQYDSRGDIVEQLNNIKDPDLRAKTKREAMWQFDQKIKAQGEARAATYEDVEKHVINGGSPENWIANNPEAWDLLSPKQQQTVLSGKAVTTNHAVLSELLLKPKNELARVEPSDYFNVLAPSDRKSLINAVKSARGEKEDDPVGRTRAAQTKAMFEQMFGGNSYSKLSAKKQERYNTLYNELDNELKYREQQKGGLLTSQEYTAMLNDFTRKATVEGFLWDSDYDLSDIPAEDVPVLSKFLRDNNYPVTSENIIRAWQQAR